MARIARGRLRRGVQPVMIAGAQRRLFRRDGQLESRAMTILAWPTGRLDGEKRARTMAHFQCDAQEIELPRAAFGRGLASHHVAKNHCCIRTRVQYLAAYVIAEALKNKAREKQCSSSFVAVVK